MVRNTNGNYTHAVLTNRASTTPDAVAITHVLHGDVTYGELQSRVNRRSNAFAAVGIQPGARVACLTYDQLTTVEVYLALAQIGAVIVAANSFWNDETLAALLERAHCTAFVYDAACDEQATRVASGLGTVERWLRIGGAQDGATDLDAVTADASDEQPEIRGFWDDAVLLSFTSGTTGLPKAVTHTHASCIENARLWVDVPRADNAAQYVGTPAVGILFTSMAAPALWGGVRLVLEENGGMQEFISAVENHRVTHFSALVSFFTGALRLAGPGADLSSLSVVTLGGEPVTRSTLETVYQRLPQVKVFINYGQSEAPHSCLTYAPLPAAGAPIQAGYTIQTGHAAKVVDANGVRIVNEVGEIWIAGPHLFAGYDSQPDKTSEVLRGDWYIGGDLGLMDEAGHLTVYGRRDDAAVRDGKFTLPSEVEEYAASLPAVSEVGAVAVEFEGAHKILLAVVVASGQSATSDELLDQLRLSVPSTHLPDAVVLVDELPYATNAAGRGKLLRREIANRWGSVFVSA